MKKGIALLILVSVIFAELLFVSYRVQIQGWYLSIFAQQDLVPWTLSQPFVCVPDVLNQNLVCNNIQLPELIRGIERDNGSKLYEGNQLIYPLEYIEHCDVSKVDECTKRFYTLDDHCIAWTALDKRGSGYGDMYLAVNCWGFSVVYSIDNKLGSAIPFATLQVRAPRAPLY